MFYAVNKFIKFIKKIVIMYVEQKSAHTTKQYYIILYYVLNYSRTNVEWFENIERWSVFDCGIYDDSLSYINFN